jgi:hypothetical protein
MVLRQEGGIIRRVLLRQPGAVFDIRKEESDRSGGEGRVHDFPCSYFSVHSLKIDYIIVDIIGPNFIVTKIHP